jgi:hypothetical protein
MYFDFMPKFNYNFPSFVDIEMVDLFRRVKFTKKTLNDAKNFESYVVRDTQRPEDVAADFYGNANLWWLVLLSNDIIDVENEWSKSSTELRFLFSNYLDGYSYFLFETLDILKGDIIIKRDIGSTGGIDIDNFGIIDSYDKILHKIDVKQSKGELEVDDEVYIFRGEGDEYKLIDGFGSTGCYKPNFDSNVCIIVDGPDEDFAPYCSAAGTTFGVIRKKDSIKDSIVEFQYDNNKINPYSGLDSFGGPTGDYLSFQNLCGMTGTILYKYLTNVSIGTVQTFSVEDKTHLKNDKMRHIKLMSPKFVSKVSNEMSTLFKGNVPKGTNVLLEQR